MGPLKSSTLITQTTSTVDTNGYTRTDALTIKGANSKVNIGATNLWNVPKTMSITGRSTYPDRFIPAILDPETLLEESLGSLTLDTKLSTILNTTIKNNLQESCKRC